MASASTRMNYNITFAVAHVAQGGGPGDARITSLDLFKSLRSRYPDKSINLRYFQISTRFDDAVESGLFKIIEQDGGKLPLADLKYACDHPDKYYPVQVERVPTDDELNQSRWLLLVPGDIEMTGHSETASDGTYLIPGVRRTKKVSYGSNSPGPWMHLFTAPLKELFLQSGLQVEFRSVRLKKGGDSGLWQLQTSIEMPPLAMTVLNIRYQPFEGGQSEGCLVSDGYYHPLVPRYREQDIAGIQDVDAAFTWERFGAAHMLHPQIIVSQRFRQMAEKLVPGQFRYSPVVVSEGDDLRTRYTIPELAPPQ
jgi:hypothetical protein